MSAHFEQTPLIQVLNTFQETHSLYFSYDPDLLKSKVVTVDFDKKSLEDALERLFQGTGLTYEVIGEKDILILPAVEAVPKTFKFTARVVDKTSGEALPYAQAIIPTLKAGMNGDKEGYIHFPTLPAGTYELKISYVGYESFSLIIKPHITQGVLTISLDQGTRKLDEVVISHGTDKFVKVADATGQLKINPRKVSRLSGLGEPDAFRAITLLPGVGGTGVSGSGLHVRGGTPDQNLVLFDGITAFRIDHFFGFFSAFNPEAIQDITIHRGGFGAKYGGRVSSIVDIKGKTGRTDQTHAGVGVNLFNTNLFFEVPLFNKKASLIVAGRRSYSDILESPVYNSLLHTITSPLDFLNQNPNLANQGVNTTSGFYSSNQKLTLDEESIGDDRINQSHNLAFYDLSTQLNYLSGNRDVLRSEATTSFQYHDLNAKLSYHLGDRDILSFTAYGGRDFLSYEYDDEPIRGLKIQTIDALRLTNYGQSLTWARQWDDQFYSKTQLAYSSYGSKYQYGFLGVDDSSGFSTFIDQVNTIRDFSLRSDYRWTIDDHNQLEFGTAVSEQDLSFSLENDSLELNSHRYGATLAAYAQHNFIPEPNVSLSLGMRSSYYDVLDKWYFEPRISMNYKASSSLSIKGAWGVYHQFLNRVKINNGLGLGEEFWALANGRNIPVQLANHFLIGTSYERPSFTVNVEAYHKVTSGLITYSFGIAPLETEEGGNDDLLSGGSSVVMGADVLVQKKIGVYTGWISYSLSTVRERFLDINLGSFYPSLQDQRHELKWVNSWSLGKWDLAVTWIYASGKPYTEAQDTWEIEYPDGSEGVGLFLGERNAQRLPAYHRLDLSATYGFQMGKNITGELGFSIYNAYHRTNVKTRRYFLKDPKYTFQDPSISSTDIYDLGFSPNIFWNIRF